MNAILSLFPAADFSPIALILAMPLLGAFVNGVFGKRLGKQAVKLMALSVMAASFGFAVLTFLSLDHQIGQTASKAMVDGHEVVKHGHTKLVWTRK